MIGIARNYRHFQQRTNYHCSTSRERSEIKDSSPIRVEIRIGDQIVFDGENVSSCLLDCRHSLFSVLIASKSKNFERAITALRHC